jgi:predicted metal-binding protein
MEEKPCSGFTGYHSCPGNSRRRTVKIWRSKQCVTSIRVSTMLEFGPDNPYRGRDRLFIKHTQYSPRVGAYQDCAFVVKRRTDHSLL